MAPLLLGLDIGTSAVKAGIFDMEGHLLGLGRSSYETDTPRPGWAECDPELWWKGAINSLSQACDEAQIRPGEIGAVGVGVLFPAVMPLDAASHALHPAILYCDQRSLAQVQTIDRTIPREKYQSLIGNALVPGTCAVTSIAWLRDEKPDAYLRSKAIGWANTFVTSRLVGDFFTDPSMAALSGLADMNDPWQWSPELCEKLNIELDRLPRIAGSAEVIGTVTGPAAKETGLRAGTPVVCGAGDVPISSVGTGALSAGTITYTAGSTDCVAVPMTRPTTDLRWVNCAYVPRGTWLGIGTTTSSGVSVEWFSREFLGKSGQNGLRLMTELASSSPPGSNRLLYLPYLQGERTPVWDPLARGIFIGLTASTARSDLARAVFEGTAFALRHVIECLESVMGGPVEQIRAVGGGTKNALWNQIKADVLQKELLILDFQETGTLGAALLAGIGSSVYGSFEEAISIARRVAGGRTVKPNPAQAELYNELFDLYSKVYPATKEIAHALGSGWTKDQ